ncbi:MAG TPA: hypothetical protein VE398_01260 [Acidobacteriota bacterium]|nr:hypothetical protein [Acidobacteriota bacterium]
MTTAGVFQDYLRPGTTLDENTILTDYWLDFVAVRQEVEEPAHRQNPAPTGELYGRIQDLGEKLEVLVEDQRRIRRQFERSIAAARPVCGTGLDGEPAAGRLTTQPGTGSKGRGRRQGLSLVDRFRNSTLYAAIQKLR